ncbi:methylated-DNA--[protein]-cysteine S-methyltransferase [Neobacillus sp. PS3-40]|jgi:methylated-DNA-[protein]-cysteine S-methyltransferase|uniref:methylated-DNA--[protein]-cysteine S-methyltransferase n=1 Tax=Neobacillus sp. PS3-40 TaxID=3070679 RepID=UPI0027DF9C07|nr:methylated-DNA--[protein]-cysteine S-methyltransferase [Neobacillus sp. PS3-40]WML42662.1 methylated-DNA--[protein]-cysteine S-methyltransferase [Neobacillus sp. PS3-40]
MKIGYAEYQSPLGAIRVIADESGIKRVEIFEEEWEEYLKENPTIQENQSLCGEAIKQLDEYFKGMRKEFDLPLSIEGTDFRKKVWDALRRIPYGEVRSYAEVAEMIGNSKAVRAVGQANKANQLPIIIPCHRVIGTSGKLVGFAGSRTPYQKKLLEAEGFMVPQTK